MLPEAAELAELSPDVLLPGRLPGLWQAETISFGGVVAYFSGGTVVKVDKGGYDEPITVPKAARDAADRSGG